MGFWIYLRCLDGGGAPQSGHPLPAVVLCGSMGVLTLALIFPTQGSHDTQ